MQKLLESTGAKSLILDNFPLIFFSYFTEQKKKL